MEETIKKAIEGLQDMPKGDTIEVCQEYMENRGTKAKKSNLKGSVISAKAILKSISILQSRASFARVIIGTLKNMGKFLLMRKSKKISEPLNLDGLANVLGITKGGVTRLIWLLEDVQNTKDGSGQYSSETISLARNALLKERILKQTTFPLDTPPLLKKNELQLTKEQWHVSDYGIKVMDAPYVGGVTEVTV